MLCLKETFRTEIETEVSALGIGPGVLAGVPAEYFIEYQIALKRELPGSFTFLAAVSNDWIGYVPTPGAFEQGGYETKLCRWSKMAPDCGDLIYAALREAAADARRLASPGG